MRLSILSNYKSIRFEHSTNINVMRIVIGLITVKIKWDKRKINQWKWFYPYSGLRLKMFDDTICTLHTLCSMLGARCYSIHCLMDVGVNVVIFAVFLLLFRVFIFHHTSTQYVCTQCVFVFIVIHILSLFSSMNRIRICFSIHLDNWNENFHAEKNFIKENICQFCSLTEKIVHCDLLDCVAYNHIQPSTFNIAIVKKAYMQQRNKEKTDMSLYKRKKKQTNICMQCAYGSLNQREVFIYSKQRRAPKRLDIEVLNDFYCHFPSHWLTSSGLTLEIIHWIIVSCCNQLWHEARFT